MYVYMYKYTEYVPDFMHTASPIKFNMNVSLVHM